MATFRLIVIVALAELAALGLALLAAMLAPLPAAAHDARFSSHLRAASLPLDRLGVAGAPDGRSALRHVVPVHDAPKGWSYPFSCCSNYDCRPVTSGGGGIVQERPEGYVIAATGEVIPYRDSRVKHSPDGDFHWCSVSGKPDGRTICLFVPPRSF